MPKYTRGEFLGMGATLAAALGVGHVPGGREQSAGAEDLLRRGDGDGAVQDSTESDLALINGRIFTMDEAQPTAQAFAVRGGRFIAVGTTEDVQNLITPRSEVIDAEGMTVTPGFIDAHCHPSGVDELFGVDLGQARTIADIQRLLRQKAQETPPGYWVDAFKYDDTKIVDETTGRYRRINR